VFKLGIRINLNNGGMSQVTGWEFNSVADLHDTLIAASDTALATLGADDDNGNDIDSFILVPTSNLNIPNPKRIRKGYLEYEVEGKLSITCKSGNLHFTEVLENSGRHEGAKVFKGNRGVYGVNWEFEIRNVDGVYFAIDYFGVLPVVLNRHRSLL